MGCNGVKGIAVLASSSAVEPARTRTLKGCLLRRESLVLRDIAVIQMPNRCPTGFDSLICNLERYSVSRIEVYSSTFLFHRE